MRYLALSILALTAGACSREFTAYSSSTSPDGLHVITVSEELQGANDPDPFWQHISVYKYAPLKPSDPGNAAIYSCHGAPKITWKSNKEAELEIDLAHVGRSFKEPPERKFVEGVYLTFVVKGTKRTP